MENKVYPIGGFAPGNYECKCCVCGNQFSGDKRAVECEPCALEAKARFDALTHEEQVALLKRNGHIANTLLMVPPTPERDLILRIVEQWGNVIEMPNMDQWLKDYAAKAQPALRWVKAGTANDGNYIAKYKEAGSEMFRLGIAIISNDWVKFGFDGRETTWRKGHEELQYLLILDESVAVIDWAKEYDTLYYIIMPALHNLRYHADNDTRMASAGPRIRNKIQETIESIKMLHQPISANEPPFLVQSEQPAAEKGEDAVMFAEWLANNYQWEYDPMSDEYRWLEADNFYTTAELYELFKQKEK